MLSRVESALCCGSFRGHCESRTSSLANAKRLFLPIGKTNNPALGGASIYKVGHPQFLQVVVLLLFYWFTRRRITSWENGPLVIAVLAYVAWLGLVSVLYVLTGYEIGQIDKGMQGEWLFLRDIVGLPTFLLAIWVLVEIVQNEIRIRVTEVNGE
jgi:hypothetical protein